MHNLAHIRSMICLVEKTNFLDHGLESGLWVPETKTNRVDRDLEAMDGESPFYGLSGSILLLYIQLENMIADLLVAHIYTAGFEFMKTCKSRKKLGFYHNLEARRSSPV